MHVKIIVNLMGSAIEMYAFINSKKTNTCFNL